MTKAASAAARSPSQPLRFFLVGSGPVIDFLEQFVVLANLHVVGLDCDSFLVRLPRLVQLPLVLVSNSQVIEGGGVGRVDFSGALPPVNGLPPQPFLCDVD